MLKPTICIAVWKAIRLDGEWARLYERLIPMKCRSDERKRGDVGRERVIGRVAGHLLSVAYTVLKKDQDLLATVPPGSPLPEPAWYDPEIHRRHRAGQYQAPSAERPRKLRAFSHQ